MSTTKPDGETVWTTGWPETGDYYRRANKDAKPELVRIKGDSYRLMTGTNGFRGEVRLMRLAAKAQEPETYEYLGPISPSDFEQLVRLRESLELAEQRLADNERWWSQEEIAIQVPESYRQAFKARAQVTRNTLDQVREALAHKGEQS